MTTAEQGHVDPGEFARQAEDLLVRVERNAIDDHGSYEDAASAQVDATQAVAYAVLALVGELRQLREEDLPDATAAIYDVAQAGG